MIRWWQRWLVRRRVLREIKKSLNVHIDEYADAIHAYPDETDAEFRGRLRRLEVAVEKASK